MRRSISDYPRPRLRPDVNPKATLPVTEEPSGIPEGNNGFQQTPKGTALMNKLIVALVASFFAISGFAASHAGAPMAGASDAKAEAKTEKKEAKADKKDVKAEKKSTKKTSAKKEEKKG